MAIRYRRTEEAPGAQREGQVETLAELEALATIGSLAAKDEVALDGVRFQRAEKIPELRSAFREKPDAGSGGVVGNILLIIALGIAGLVALGFIFKIAAFALKLGVIAGIGLGAFWLIRKLLK
jgi:hypothetical protein